MDDASASVCASRPAKAKPSARCAAICSANGAGSSRPTSAKRAIASAAWARCSVIFADAASAKAEYTGPPGALRDAPSAASSGPRPRTLITFTAAHNIGWKCAASVSGLDRSSQAVHCTTWS